MEKFLTLMCNTTAMATLSTATFIACRRHKKMKKSKAEIFGHFKALITFSAIKMDASF